MRRKLITKILTLCVSVICLFPMVSANAKTKEEIIASRNNYSEYKEWNNSWLFENGQWHYILNEQKATGIQTIDGLLYYFNSEGNMPVGWSKVGNEWIYSCFDKSPLAVSEWYNIGNKWYYFNSNGLMAHDTYVGKYYVGSDGACV